MRKCNVFLKIKWNIFKIKYIYKTLKNRILFLTKSEPFFLGVVMAYTYQHLNEERTVLDPRTTVKTFNQRPLEPFCLCNSEKSSHYSAHCNLKIFRVSVLNSVTMHSISVVMQLLIVHNFWLTTQEKHLLIWGALIRREVWGIEALTLQATTKNASDF